MTTQLPIDTNNRTIPVLRLAPGKAHILSTSAVSERNQTAFDPTTRVISLYATTATYIRFGNASVVATAADHFLPADTLVDLSIAADDTQSFTHVAALRAASDGIVYVSEKF